MAERSVKIPNVIRRTVRDPDSGAERAFFVGTIRSDLAKILTFVPVLEHSTKTYLEEETTDGYQRPGSAARMRAFGEYVRENPLSVVPPVILSGRSGWRFKGSGTVGEVEVFENAAVVDGQHRLGGFVYLFEQDKVRREIDFFLLADLTLDQEKEEFLAINNTQRGVPKSINVFLGGSDNAVIGTNLNTREDSPFYGRITIAKPPKNALFTLNAVEKNVGRTFDHGAFTDVSVDAKIDLLIEYWNKIADEFDEEWADIDRRASEREFKLLETTGLIAWSLAGSDILGTSFDADTGQMNWDSVVAKIAKVGVEGALNWRKDGDFEGLTGEVGGARIHKKIQQILAKNTDSDDSAL
uniref:DGQHR domain-containing protein n=1 Tax=Gordonia sp. B7-2 TaxID=3420932 RepID=UPI003D947280